MINAGRTINEHESRRFTQDSDKYLIYIAYFFIQLFRGRAICPLNRLVKLCVDDSAAREARHFARRVNLSQLPGQYSSFQKILIILYFPHPVPPKGRIMIAATRGAGSGGRGSVRRASDCRAGFP